MSKYEIKADGCDYGIYENGNLRLFVNSQANALLIKYVLEQDSQHKVVIADLVEKMSKKKRKLRAITNAEFCDKWRKNHLFCKSIVSGGYCCPISPTGNCFRESFLNKPYIINGKYIFIEVKK